MARKLIPALCVLLFGAGNLLADDFTGKVSKVDADKNMIYVVISNRERPIRISDQTKFFDAKDKAIGNNLKEAAKNGLKEGSEVKITFDTDGKKAYLKKVKLVK